MASTSGTKPNSVVPYFTKAPKRQKVPKANAINPSVMKVVPAKDPQFDFEFEGFDDDDDEPIQNRMRIGMENKGTNYILIFLLYRKKINNWNNGFKNCNCKHLAR